MYRVYTQSRPAHPRWAALVTASLLALSLLLAAWLGWAKNRRNHVALEDQDRILIGARLKVRLPVGWKQVRSQFAMIPGVVLELRSPHAENELLLLFRGIPRPNGTVSLHAAEAGRQLAPLLGAGTPQQTSWATIGPLPAWTAVFWPTRPDRPPMHLLVRTAMAPDGQILGLLILLQHPPIQQNFELLDDLSSHLELTDLAPADAPEAYLREAGIVFNLPPETTLFAPTGPKLSPGARLLLSGGQADEGWFLEAGRVPLIGPRTIQQIATDYARSARQTIELPKTIQETGDAKRPTARITLPATDADPSPLLVGCAQIDPHTALLVAGRPEPQGQANLDRALANILAESHVTSYSDTLDSGQAAQRGQQLLDTLRREGLSAGWRDRVSEGEHYAIRCPGLPLKQEIRTYEMQVDQERNRWWTLRTNYLPLSPILGMPVTVEEYWSIRDDTIAHVHKYVQQLHGEPEVAYTEVRPPDKQVVHCEMTIHKQQPIRWQVQIDQTYNCEPVLTEATSRLATEANAHPAVFSTTEQYVQQPCYWLTIPLGEAPLPIPGEEKQGRLVRMLRDYDLTPVDLYYGSDGRLLAVSFGHLFWRQRTDNIEKPILQHSVPRGR